MSRSFELLTDACEALTHRVQRMFGGHGFFAPNGGMFAAILSNDEIMVKLVEGSLRDELIALGGHPWVYDGHRGATTMGKWIVVPERFYDDSEALAEWASKAHNVVPPKKFKPKTKSKPKKQPAKPRK